jgi:hypothetical protein
MAKRIINLALDADQGPGGLLACKATLTIKIFPLALFSRAQATIATAIGAFFDARATHRAAEDRQQTQAKGQPFSPTALVEVG